MPGLPASSGNARSTWMTCPKPERALPKRSPKPTSFSSPRLGRRERRAAPGAPMLVENRPAHAEEAKRIPVGEVALLDGEQRTPGAVLIAQRITAQAVVAAQKNLIVEIQVPALGAAAASCRRASSCSARRSSAPSHRAGRCAARGPPGAPRSRSRAGASSRRCESPCSPRRSSSPRCWSSPSPTARIRVAARGGAERRSPRCARSGRGSRA